MSLWRDRRWRLLGLGLLAAWFCLVNGWQATAALLGAAVCHEGGHLLALWVLGGRVRAFSLSPFGAELRADGVRLSYPRELCAVLAGPGANFLCGAALAAGNREWAAMAAGANWVLGAFNLLPAAPLDGWRALELLACWRLGPDRGAVWSGRVGALGAAALCGGLLWLMGRSGGSLWLLPAAAGVGISGLRQAASCHQGG